MSVELRYTVVPTTSIVWPFEVYDAARTEQGNPIPISVFGDETEARAFAARHNAADLLERRRDISNALEALADVRPALTFREVCPDGCNIPDHTIRMEIQRFMERWDVVDVSDLADEDGNQDVEAWEYRAGGPVRFVAKEIEREIEDAEAGEEGVTETVYQVIDTERDGDVLEEYSDEDDANTDAEDRNRDHRIESLYGFPFAHNYARIIHERDVEDFAASGFLVWENTRTGKLYAGIDGGGYSYEGAHYAPLWWRAACRGGWLVETETGPRRVRSPE